jgi:hypothetical protein
MKRLIQKYINIYLHKRLTQTALWQRYISSHLNLGKYYNGAHLMLMYIIEDKMVLYYEK